MRRLSIFLIVFLLLAACTAPATPTPVATTEEWAESNSHAADGDFATSLLVTKWNGGMDDTLLYPLDPSSGTALPGYEPISLGFSFSHMFSADRQTLAVISFPNDRARDGSLLLIDLPAWKTQRFEIGLDGWVHSMAFSPDSSKLAIAHGDTSYQLTVLNLNNGTVTAQSEMKSVVSRLRFTHDGQALMVYSLTLEPTQDVNAAAPSALLLDVDNLQPLWSAELKTVHDGIFATNETVTQANLYEPGNALYISPGLVFAPESDILYIVHADSQHLTTVDFENHVVKTVEIRSSLGLFELFLSMTAGVAHAKVADGSIRQAVISPDGQFLYAVGVKNSTSPDQNGNWEILQDSLGLEILRTSDGSRVSHIETDATELSLSEDGRLLYLRSWGNSQGNIPWTEIYDTSTWQLVARKEAISGMPALLMNGESILVSTYSTDERAHHMSILELDGVDLLSAWSDTSYVWWLSTY
jgi:WD40 repeat protein